MVRFTVKSLLMTCVPGGSGGDVTEEMRERPASTLRLISGARYDCASNTCARAASMRASVALRSRLFSIASLTSWSSTGSLKNVQ